METCMRLAEALHGHAAHTVLMWEYVSGHLVRLSLSLYVCVCVCVCVCMCVWSDGPCCICPLVGTLHARCVRV